MGQAVGVSVDAHDHIFVVHRPLSVRRPTEAGAAADPKIAECCVPAPPVLEFDEAGNLIGHWGGPGEGYDWPAVEHGIAVDPKGNVWLGANGSTDRQILEFTHDGKFIEQIGKPGERRRTVSAPPTSPAWR